MFGDCVDKMVLRVLERINFPASGALASTSSGGDGLKHAALDCWVNFLDSPFKAPLSDLAPVGPRAGVQGPTYSHGVVAEEASEAAAAVLQGEGLPVGGVGGGLAGVEASMAGCEGIGGFRSQTD